MPSPSRRIALRWSVVATGSAILLSGCGIRLEEDAPHVPLIPERTPIPQEANLVALLHHMQSLRAAVPAEYAAGLARQVEVLDSALRQGGVPADLLAAPTPSEIDRTAPSSTTSASAGSSSTSTTPGASGSGSPSTSATTTDPAKPDAVGLALVASSAAQEVLPGAASALRPTLAAMTVSWDLLRQSLDSNATQMALHPGKLPQAAALTLLSAAREAVYGLEVAAARSGGATRKRAIASLQTVRGRVSVLEGQLGDSAPATPSAYTLPLSVSDDSTARRLIRHLTAGLVTACGATLPEGTADPKTALASAGWLWESAALDAEWGAPWSAFPGLA
ncbi:MAG: ferritin-like domain-containing protein [Actinobacteria bacterium]|nr:ferritin-like domain-containing protein [Actinomycetota bacterium]